MRHTGLALLEDLGDIMTAQVHHAGSVTRTRRHGAGVLKLSQRDIDGLLLCGEQYGAPYDLMAISMGAAPVRMRQVVKRWRDFGYADTAQLGPGPTWCWLTRAGMTAAGLRYSAVRPALGRLAHIRAVIAARLWLEGGQAWQDGQAWWRSERRLQTGRPRAATGHVADAEIHWPSLPGRPHAGQIWALEVELTPKPIARTAEIMDQLLSPQRYATVVYLTGPAARSVVLQAAASLPGPDRSRVAVRDLPATAFRPEQQR
jgi:hypothetical protein